MGGFRFYGSSDLGGESREMESRHGLISVLCVDDSESLAKALRLQLGNVSGFVWHGWLPDAANLAETVEREHPSIVVLDIDMAGKDPFEALAEVVARCPETRVIMYSGHVRRELVQKAIDSGAWGYVSKAEGEHVLMAAIKMVAVGEFVLSNEARQAIG